MRYHIRYLIKVYREALDDPEDLVELVNREFTFSESSHKITDVIHMAVDQLEAEGGQSDA